MTTIRTYVRVARKQGNYHGSPYVVDANTTPNPRSLTKGAGSFREQQLHTLHFALDLNIPDELLSPAKWPVIEVHVDTAEQVPIEIEVPAAEEVA
jgi:hypothetical protein